jgi:hypothetical protein
MPADAPEIHAGSGPPKTRLLSLGDIDKRTQAYRKTVELISGIEQDLGGRDRLSSQEICIVQRIGVLAAIASSEESKWISGEPISVVDLCTVNNTLRRMLREIGLKRQSRPVNEIDQHLLNALKEEATRYGA